MHLIQALTSIHDRYLAPTRAPPTPTEAYHWSRGTGLFSQMLSRPIEPSDREATWATCAVVGVIAFSLIEATTPEEAWPIKPSTPSDFAWIRMAEGKKTIREQLDPSKSSTRFDVGTKEHSLLTPTTKSWIEGLLPPIFTTLYGLNDGSTAANNPYHAAVHAFAPLLHLESKLDNMARFFSFVTHLDPDFKDLLYLKDPRALLLLAYFYAKIYRIQWWMDSRSELEGQAICIYLERYYAGDTAIQELLQFPKTRLGLSPAPDANSAPMPLLLKRSPS